MDCTQEMIGVSEPRFDETSAEVSVRRGCIAAAAFAGLCAVGGLTLVAVKVVSGAYAEAVLTLIVAIATCGIGLLAMGAMRLGQVVIANAAELAALRYRMDSLEASFEAQGIDMELDPSAGSPADLVGAVLPRDQYPRLVGENQVAAESGESADAVESIIESRNERGPKLGVVSDVGRARELREEFAAHVRSEHYEQALALGKEIVNVAPASRMAMDFESIRERLVELAASQARSRAKAL